MSETYTTRELAEAAATAKSAEMLLTGEMEEFNGQNCDESEDDGSSCLGWDGNDNRCDCGNRKVSWAFDKNTDDTWYFYSAAY